jgi:hypothetical protein
LIEPSICIGGEMIKVASGLVAVRSATRAVGDGVVSVEDTHNVNVQSARAKKSAKLAPKPKQIIANSIENAW